MDIKILSSLQTVDSHAWNALVSENNPFMEYEFLNSFELAQVVGVDTAWHPKVLIAEENGQLIGAIPFYLKFDSYGEFIWDFEWAAAFQKAGLKYYPKVLAAVPFTPATGERILVRADQNFEKVSERMLEYLWSWTEEHQYSSLHFLFVNPQQLSFLEQKKLMPRLSFQYHWMNQDYQKFEDWLTHLKAKKAGEIRRERRRVADLKLDIEILTGDQIELLHLYKMAEFYLNTCSRKWGPPRLNTSWFEQMYLLPSCRKNLVLVMAKQAGQLVAGTINFRKGNHLYGRYWGALGDFPYLHFECCYYQLIEYAIREKITLFEAGAQGEHKFVRGFDAKPTYSAHAFTHAQASVGIGRFLKEERVQIQHILTEYDQVSAYRKN